MPRLLRALLLAVLAVLLLVGPAAGKREEETARASLARERDKARARFTSRSMGRLSLSLALRQVHARVPPSRQKKNGLASLMEAGSRALSSSHPHCNLFSFLLTLTLPCPTPSRLL